MLRSKPKQAKKYIYQIWRNNKYLFSIAGAIYGFSFLISVLYRSPCPSCSRFSPAPLSIPSHVTYAVIEQNLRVNLLLWTGFLSFGFQTIILLLVNGATLGAAYTSALTHGPWLIVITALVPHAIPELLGLFTASAAGLKSLQALVRHLRGGDFLTKRDVIEYLILVGLSCLLTIIAGIIEANVTPLFLRPLLGKL